MAIFTKSYCNYLINESTVSSKTICGVKIECNNKDEEKLNKDFSAIKKGYFDALNKEYFEFIKYNHWDFIHPVDLTADYVKRGSKLKQISFKAGILKDTVKFLMNYNNSEIIIILDISKNKVTNTGCTHPSKYVNMD